MNHGRCSRDGDTVTRSRDMNQAAAVVTATPSPGAAT